MSLETNLNIDRGVKCESENDNKLLDNEKLPEEEILISGNQEK